jgi:hypothetical protein
MTPKPEDTGTHYIDDWPANRNLGPTLAGLNWELGIGNWECVWYLASSLSQRPYNFRSQSLLPPS